MVGSVYYLKKFNYGTFFAKILDKSQVHIYTVMPVRMNQ